MNYMPINNKDFESFESEYQKEEKEIFVLISDQSGGAAKFWNSWEASEDFLAYVDITSNELKKGDGHINWLISDEEEETHGISWPYHFKQGVIYRLKARELIDKTVPEGLLPSSCNRFMIVDVLEEDVQNGELLAILAEYRKTIKIVDEVLGEFELNKDWGMFNGEINWLGEEISASLEVNAENKSSWTKAMKALRILFEQQQQQDSEFRTFAAEHLTKLANDWREDKGIEISTNDFINRISHSELTVTSSGNYTAYYDDDDMFAGHVVTVHGNNKKGIKSATIEG